MSEFRPPRENLVRALRPGIEVRAADDGAPVLHGHFLRFNEWTEIDSVWEGRFLERISPGAATKTLAENRMGMRVLFQHGRDPEVGDKPIAAINELREDDEGVYYEGSLFPSVPPLIVDGLRAGQYGASFRFRVVREEINAEPKRTEQNPEGLPERTIKELHIMEFGPVTFPAYAGATAGVRSLTDEFVASKFTTGEGLRKLAEMLRNVSQDEAQPQGDAPSTDAGQEPTSEERREEPDQTPARPLRHAEWMRLRAKKEPAHA